ncbi:MAG: PAS domain S-box protein [Gallionellaceae bacterium]|nr:PAS domain S-box protein [Gallionellaceae bacterium]
MSDSPYPTSTFRTCAPDCHALFEASGDAIFLLEGMHFVACNPSTLTLFACTEKDILGKTPWDFSPPRQADGGDSEALARGHILSAYDGLAQLFEWRHRRLDGGIFEAEIRLNLIKRSDGPLLQAIVRDITVRKQALVALRESRDYAEQLLSVSGAMLLVLDRQGRVTRINPAGCAILRGTKADIQGRDWFEDFLPERVRGEVRAMFQRVLAGDVDSSIAYDNPVLTRSGEERHLTWHNTPLRDAEGKVCGVLSSGLDISGQRRAEAALIESESRIRAILDTAVDGILVVDEASRVVFANPAICRLIGYSAKELRDRPLTDLMPERYRGRHEAGFNRYLSGGQPSMPWRELAFVLLRRDGREIPVEVSIGERGGPGQRQFIGVMRDVSERQRTQQTLREREERINLLLDSMAEGIYGVDTRGDCTFVNPAGLRLLGYERAEDLLGRHIHELIHHSHGDGTPYPAGECRAYRAYVEEQGIHVEDEVFWRHDGTAFPVEYWSYPMRRDGQVVGSVVTFLDISERRQGEERLYAARQMLQHVINTVPHFVFWKDRDSRYLGCNEAFAHLGDMARPEDLIGRNDFEMPWNKFADLYRRDDVQVMETQTAKYNIVEPMALENGHTTWLETSKVPLRDSQGQVIGVLGVFQDITARREAEERLRQSAKVFESTTDGVSITDPAGNMIAINRAFTEITGYTEAEALGRNPRILKSGRQDKAFYQALWNSIAQTGSWSGELWNRRKNGEVYPEWLTISGVTDEAGNLTNYVGVFSDISQIKQSEAERERLAHFDPLTGLPNRLLFNARLDHAIQRAERDNSLLTLLFIDLDRFKNINDALGHPAGDRVLQDVARRLSHCGRSEDTVSRLGGDEFAMALEGQGSATLASGMADKLLATLTLPFDLDGQAVFVGASIGISIYPTDGKDAATLLKNADAAMHQSKDDGRNTFRFYNAAMTRAARERLTLETNLRRAIEQQEFLVYYQPQVDVSSGAILGVEALVRWDHPASGLIAPDRFIPLAEETGLIVPLGEWVLFTACAQARAWLDDADLPTLSVAVNLSPRQFRQHNLAAHVRSVLDACGLPAALLELEITESAIMENPGQAIATLQALKDLGITISIDDFGTGYSSLAHLKRFPIDKLKIDQSFMRDIPQDHSDMEIAATIIAMARNLHLKVLAEGVETEEQLAFLQIHGCDSYQGYLCSRPVPAPTLEAWLQGREPMGGTP